MSLRTALILAALSAAGASLVLGYAPLLALEGALRGRWLVASGGLLASALLLAFARAWLPAAGLAWTLAVVSFFKARILPLRFAYNEDQQAAVEEFLIAAGAGLVTALVLAVIARTRRAPPATPSLDSASAGSLPCCSRRTSARWALPSRTTAPCTSR